MHNTSLTRHKFNTETGFTGRSVQRTKGTKTIKFKWEEDESYLSSFLLKLFNCSLVNAPTLVDEVAGSGGLAWVDMSYYHNVYVELLLPHRDSQWWYWEAKKWEKEINEARRVEVSLPHRQPKWDWTCSLCPENMSRTWCMYRTERTWDIHCIKTW